MTMSDCEAFLACVKGIHDNALTWGWDNDVSTLPHVYTLMMQPDQLPMCAVDLGIDDDVWDLFQRRPLQLIPALRLNISASNLPYFHGVAFTMEAWSVTKRVDA